LRDCFYDTERREFLTFFRDGHVYRLARQLVPDDDGTDVLGVRVESDGSAFFVRLASGKTLEIPWDFVLYQLEPTYPFFKGRVREGSQEEGALRIGRRVRELREGKDLTTYELAKRSGIHRPNISRIESGKHVPTLDTLMRLAQALGVSVAGLVAEASPVQAYVRERGPRLRRSPKKQASEVYGGTRVREFLTEDRITSRESRRVTRRSRKTT
jgi:transcriptional regulator with XRE-family HTH domain